MSQRAASFPSLAYPDGKVVNDLEILVNLLDHPRTANLHDHFGPVVERGGMCLTDGRASQREAIKRGERLVRGTPELAADDVVDDVRGNIRGVVLEPG